MAFFVPESKGQPKKGKEPTRLDTYLLSIGKKIGLSFVEINELRIIDLIDLAKDYSGVEDDKPREATQEDIDAFYR